METVNFAAGAGRVSRIEVARSGVFLAKRGGRVELTPKDLADIAASVDPKQPVILKIGHDEITTATPDCGVVLAAEYDAKKDRLVADVKPTDYLVEQNRKGAFTKISMELFRKAGRYVLDAIAFLGAHNPAIHGLEPVALASGAVDRILVCCAAGETDTGGLTEIQRVSLFSRGDVAAADPGAFAHSEIHDRVEAYMLAYPNVRYVEALKILGARSSGDGGDGSSTVACAADEGLTELQLANLASRGDPAAANPGIQFSESETHKRVRRFMLKHPTVRYVEALESIGADG